MTLKRIRSLHDLLGDTNDQSITIPNCLVFFSQVKDSSPSSSPTSSSYPKNINHQFMTNCFSGGRVFECKTCNRRFPSFQALGGHRASHRKPRSVTTATGAGLEADHPSPSKTKSTHECSICGLEFPIGQALGGHMRRHRATSNNDNHNGQRLEQGGGGGGGDGRFKSPPRRAVQEISGITRRPVVKKFSSGKKVVLSLDLNLTPFENGLEFLKLGQAAPMVDCFL